MALCELTIHNFAIIKQLQIEIDNGLTVVTGETGAGKSIILNALNLILGARAETNMIRHDENQCQVTAVFNINKLPNVAAWLDQNDFGNDQYCLVRRVVRRDKPTRCYINDQSTTLNSLKELGLMLVDLHGQHEHQSLLRQATQRQILDNIGANHLNLKQLAALASKANRVSNSLTQLTQTQSDQTDRIALLEFQLQEFEQVALHDNEYQQLEQEHSRLNNAQQLINGIQNTLDDLFNNEASNVSTQLGISTRQIDELSSVDNNLKPPAELLNSALAQIDETRTSLESALAHIELDPQRLQEVEQRMDTIINLARKHNCNEHQLLERQQTLQQQFDDLQNLHLQPEALALELDQLKKEYFELAQSISAKRQKISTKLGEEITEQMQDLGMQGGHLSIKVKQTESGDADRFSETGIDQIEFLVSTNQGVPLKPLHKTASGGELSRISLAIQVIISRQSQTPTLVFDEVDVGVGGRVAEMVGQRLRDLGNHAQVLCITHLPQVAAQGHQHWQVNKESEQGETWSSLHAIDAKQRTSEIARMLGGAQITDRTLAHAREMLKQAS